MFWLGLTLPLAAAARDLPAAAAPDEAECEAPTPFAGQRVLLVEDNPVNQEIAVAMLTHLGLAVDVAGDGEEALAKAASTDHALVLMDIQMPGMDGLQATRLLRLRGWRGPIIAMTANAFAEERQRCLDAGMDDHLPKPVLAPVLEAMLARWLAQRPSTEADAAPAAQG